MPIKLTHDITINMQMQYNDLEIFIDLINAVEDEEVIAFKTKYDMDSIAHIRNKFARMFNAIKALPET